MTQFELIVEDIEEAVKIAIKQLMASFINKIQVSNIKRSITVGI
jgi:hypothetical protein